MRDQVPDGELMQRFLTQADTIEELGQRLGRIRDRHAVSYGSTMEEVHKLNPRCDHCRWSWPCPDWLDADWLLQA